MTLAELFKKLSYSHLSELPIAGEGMGIVPDEHKPKLIQRINEALIVLYTRFPLRLKTLTLQTYAAVNEYVLHSENSATADPVPEYPYITSVFEDDLLMIDSITDDEGDVVPFNDPNEEESWHLVGTDPDVRIVVEEPEDDTVFQIRYRAMPSEIGFAAAASTVIPIPRHLEAAMLAYVAGLMYGNMSMEGALAKSQHFLDMAENEMKIVEERNSLNSSIAYTNQKPELNGWP